MSSPYSKILVRCNTQRPRLLIFHLQHFGPAKTLLLFGKILMTLLPMICGLPRQINILATLIYWRVCFCSILNFFFFVICNFCNYILFTKLPWPGDSERTFRSSSQAATCSPVYHTRRRLHTVPLMLNVKQGSCEYQFL